MDSPRKLHILPRALTHFLGLKRPRGTDIKSFSWVFTIIEFLGFIYSCWNSVFNIYSQVALNSADSTHFHVCFRQVFPYREHSFLLNPALNREIRDLAESAAARPVRIQNIIEKQSVGESAYQVGNQVIL